VSLGLLKIVALALTDFKNKIATMIAKKVQLTNYLLRFYGIAHKTGLFVIGRYFLYPVDYFLQFF
jgi:hypothetical protein